MALERSGPTVRVVRQSSNSIYLIMHNLTSWDPLREFDVPGDVDTIFFKECSLPSLHDLFALVPLEGITNLLFNKCEIDDISGIEALPRVECLAFGGNMARAMPRGPRMESVTAINANGCPLTSLEGFDRFPNLAALCIDNTAITSFEGLEGCPNVKTISARFCTSLGSLRGLQNARKLKKLDLTMHGVEWGGNIREPGRLTSLHGLEHCESLVELDVTGHCIESLAGLGNCKWLVQVIARHNRIASTRGVEGCKMLDILALGDNRIERVEGFGGLTRLRGLSLNDNPVIDIAGLAPLARTLKYVNIDNTGVASLELFRKFALESMSCEHCKVTSLEPLREMATLKELYVSGSPVESLEPVEGLRELRKLHAAGCGLTEAHVPASSTINELVLRDNAITAFTLPPHVRRLFMLDTEPAIDLSGNPLSTFSIDEWFSTNDEPCVIALASTVPITSFEWPAEDAPRFGLEVFRAWEVDEPGALEARMRWLFPNETSKDDLAQLRKWVFWRSETEDY